MFIKHILEEEAEGKLLDIYESDRNVLGYVPNHSKVFSLRPDVLETWKAFQGSIRKNIRLRRYELVTLAAAIELKCRYCILAHSSILIKNGISMDQIRLILTDFNNAGLEKNEVAMMNFAQKIIRNANKITQEDINLLRDMNLSDNEILDITLVATMRSFASKTFDSLGAKPDAIYSELEHELNDLLNNIISVR